MENMASLFAGIDIKYIYIAVGILVIGVLLSIIKKAFKLGLIVLVIAAILTYGGTAISKLQSKYQIESTGSTISLQLNGKPYSLDYSEIVSIEAQDLGNGKERLSISKLDSSKTFIDVPQFIYNIIKEKAEEKNIKITER